MTPLTGHQMIAFRRRLGALRVSYASISPIHELFLATLIDDEEMNTWIVQMTPLAPEGPRLGRLKVDEMGVTSDHSDSPITMELFAAILRTHWDSIEKGVMDRMGVVEIAAKMIPAAYGMDQLKGARRVLEKIREIAAEDAAETAGRAELSAARLSS